MHARVLGVTKEQVKRAVATCCVHLLLVSRQSFVEIIMNEVTSNDLGRVGSTVFQPLLHWLLVAHIHIGQDHMREFTWQVNVLVCGV